MKNPIAALTLSVFPGLGHIYNGKILKGLFYLITVVGAELFAVVLFMNNEPDLGVISFFIGLILYIISFIDMGRQLSKSFAKKTEGAGDDAKPGNQESERFYAIILSLIPGLGHFQLGLMNRGVTLLASFIGCGVMVMFVTVMTGRGEFLVFLAVLPIIWLYGFFDATVQLNKKQRGEILVDRTIFEEFEMRREDGKKSRAIATFLSIFPGAGHLYLGLQRRGIQLMAAFLFAIYILDVLRLGIFLFLIPIIWFYSFFDGLQKASRSGSESLEDVPVITYFVNHQRWVGIGLVVLGFYYLFTNIFLPVFQPIIARFVTVDMYMLSNYLQTAIVCILLIGGGLKLLAGNKEKKGESGV
ncbi:hypothetical protein D1B31_02290 [Neobacillus notoginsengisoli]|uniref:Multi-TM2 domain-containing protein n=1 Tax=Neobacillus notoginsengisoli TaxID=1578198 RepID=A0A417Z0S6_9BACI|nr:hypothetical protein [Neobacillus notoginsengisoli]RHW43508.1 hypothetical protein D1B31_02290 [Neobacillus notoginsengisoli]